MTLPPMAKGIRNSGGEGEALELLSRVARAWQGDRQREGALNLESTEAVRQAEVAALKNAAAEMKMFRQDEDTSDSDVESDPSESE